MFSKVFAELTAAKRIAYFALAAAIGTILNFLVIDLSPSNKLTFTYLFSFFTGYLFGALPAFAAGLLGDFLGWAIRPDGVYWLFGVTLGLFGVISGVIMNYGRPKNDSLKSLYLKTLAALVAGYISITCILNSAVGYSFYVLFVDKVAVKKTFWLWLSGRLGIQTVIYAANAALCFVMLPLVAKLKARIK